MPNIKHTRPNRMFHWKRAQQLIKQEKAVYYFWKGRRFYVTEISRLEDNDILIKVSHNYIDNPPTEFIANLKQAEFRHANF